MPKTISLTPVTNDFIPHDAPHVATPIAVAREFYTHFARRDMECAFALFSPQIEFSQIADLPWAGRIKGIEGVRQFFSVLSKHVSATPEPLTFLPAGDEVAVVARLRGIAQA